MVCHVRIKDEDTFGTQGSKDSFCLMHAGIANITTKVVGDISLWRDIERNDFVVASKALCVTCACRFDAHHIAIFLEQRLPAEVRLEIKLCKGRCDCLRDGTLLAHLHYIKNILFQ